MAGPHLLGLGEVLGELGGGQDAELGPVLGVQRQRRELHCEVGGTGEKKGTARAHRPTADYVG